MLTMLSGQLASPTKTFNLMKEDLSMTILIKTECYTRLRKKGSLFSVLLVSKTLSERKFLKL